MEAVPLGADLALLSACQTSAGDEKLSEEVIHLAAGMLAAGYRGAVATMWSIRDHNMGRGFLFRTSRRIQSV